MFLDFRTRDIINDCITVGLATKGSFTLRDLMDMGIEDYLYVVRECRKITEKLYGKGDDK